MNNIEIIEEFIKYFEAEATQRKYRRNISITVGEDDIEAIQNLIKEYKELKEKISKYENQLDLDYVEENYIPKSKVKEKIEELNKRIDYLNKELAEAYIQREKLGTETELDANEQYIYNMEQERSIRHTEKYAYLKLLEGE